MQTHPLQAVVSELLEPVHPTVVMSNAVHVYVSQAHKGELVMGAGVDAYNGYGQRGAFHVIERQMSAAVELFPIFARAHLLRTWAGIVDVCPDASPIVDRTPYDNVFLNCGWGTGGFKATPGHRLVPGRDPGQRRDPPVHQAVQPRPVRHRRPRRRTRRGRRRPLTRREPMQLIECPWCGPREETEFQYGGQAHVAYPETRPTCPTSTGRTTCSSATTPRASGPNAGTTAPAAAAGSTPCATP